MELSRKPKKHISVELGSNDPPWGNITGASTMGVSPGFLRISDGRVFEFRRHTGSISTIDVLDTDGHLWATNTLNQELGSAIPNGEFESKLPLDDKETIVLALICATLTIAFIIE